MKVPTWRKVVIPLLMGMSALLLLALLVILVSNSRMKRRIAEFERISTAEPAVPTTEATTTEEPVDEGLPLYLEGRDYYLGRDGREFDMEKAKELMLQAADKGSVDAWVYLGYIENRSYDPAADERALAYYQKAADAGSGLGMFQVGECYRTGSGVERNLDQAKAWYDKAINLGYPEGNLGYCNLYRYSNSGIEKNYPRAISYAEAASESEDEITRAMAYDYLAYMYAYADENTGMEPDVTKAISYTQNVIDLEYSAGYFRMGWLYYEGLGLTQDYAKALEYYGEGVKHGNGGSMNMCGEIYAKGRGVDKDMLKALEYYTMSANLGYQDAVYNMGWCYANLDTPDYEHAKVWYERSAALGDESGEFGLAILYYKGNGVEQDYVKARELFESAAEKGENSAWCWLGQFYKNGYGVEQDYAKALEYFQKGSDAGDSYATNLLGVMYDNGYGVEQDYAKAFELYSKSSEADNPDAFGNLGYMYYKGNGVEQDPAKAFELFRKGCELGDGYSAYMTGKLYHSGEGVEKNYDLAIEKYIYAATKTDEKVKESYYQLGTIYGSDDYAGKNPETARNYYNQARQLAEAEGDTDFVAKIDERLTALGQ